MPYIRQNRRKEIDSLYNGLLEVVGGLTHGDLNYIISNLLNRYIEKKEKTYSTYNSVIGILECAKLELYNRLVTPYENIKIVENGGLYKEQTSDLLTLKSEYIKVKNEINSYKLVESLHECDSWRETFNRNTLSDKLSGIQVAIENFIYHNGLQEKVIGIEDSDEE
jgi:hypothetical protein